MTDHLIQSENDLLLTHFIRHQADKYRETSQLFTRLFRSLNDALAGVITESGLGWKMFR